MQSDVTYNPRVALPVRRHVGPAYELPQAVPAAGTRASRIPPPHPGGMRTSGRLSHDYRAELTRSPHPQPPDIAQYVPRLEALARAPGVL